MPISSVPASTTTKPSDPKTGVPAVAAVVIPAVAAVKPAPRSESSVDTLKAVAPSAKIDTVEEAESSEGVIDMETFNQVLELDDDDTDEFSKGMVWAYFSQAETTFVEMDNAFTKKDLKKLSELGHFLKGSSAALGVAKVQDTCEKIQHLGLLRDEELDKDLTSAGALDAIKPLLVRVKKEYSTAEKWLKNYFGNDEPPPLDV